MKVKEFVNLIMENLEEKKEIDSSLSKKGRGPEKLTEEDDDDNEEEDKKPWLDKTPTDAPPKRLKPGSSAASGKTPRDKHNMYGVDAEKKRRGTIGGPRTDVPKTDGPPEGPKRPEARPEKKRHRVMEEGDVGEPEPKKDAKRPGTGPKGVPVKECTDSEHEKNQGTSKHSDPELEESRLDTLQETFYRIIKEALEKNK